MNSSGQKPVTDLYPFIRRICDLTTPNLTTKSISGRSENRYNRTIPTLITPWHRNKPAVERSAICITCDLADRGVGLVLCQPCKLKEVVLGYWLRTDRMPEPWFFLGEVKRNQDIGGGFWTMGVELVEFANSERKRQIRPLRDIAGRLLPKGF
jgi:hypothetical protein